MPTKDFEKLDKLEEELIVIEQMFILYRGI